MNKTIASLSVVALILSGCGGGSDSPEAPVVAATPEPTLVPAPTPASPTELTCAETQGAGTDGITLEGGSLTSSINVATQKGTGKLDPGEIAFQNTSLPVSARTGPLRIRLVASPTDYAGEPFTGHVIAEYPLDFGGNINTLGNGEGSDLAEFDLPMTLPLTGKYCKVILLEEMKPDRCASADGYCTVDYAQFNGVNENR